MIARQDIRLERVSRLNWKDCIALSVAESQKEFIPTNLYSIAEAQFYADACPLVIYNSADQMIGFAMYGRDVASGKWKIFRLMVDFASQGQGYGNRILAKLIAEIANKPDAEEIIICYHRANTAARKLYLGFGFSEQLTDEYGVTTAILKT